MSEQEKQAGAKLVKNLETLPPEKREWLLGVAQGMAMMTDAQTAHQTAKPTKA